jgi:hypothetical protein
MWSIRSFDRRIPLAPTIIALALITLLVLTNLYGPAPDAQRHRDGSAPSPVAIPPQLPAQDQSGDAAPVQTDTPNPASASPPASTMPADTQPGPGATVTKTVTATVTAPPPAAVSTTGGGASDRSDTGKSVPTPSPPAATTTDGGGGGATSGPSIGPGGGENTAPPADKRLRVTKVQLAGDRANGARVRCNGLDEVVFGGTVFVDGGAGDIVYQWVFDGRTAWPVDYLSFTGSGARQKTVSVAWSVPPQLVGKIRGSLQLRIYQPVAYAQTKLLDINFVCA